MTHLLKFKKGRKREMKGGGCNRCGEPKMVVFRENVFDFSLDLRHIRSSAVFGPRRKNVLRGAGYAWTPVL